MTTLEKIKERCEMQLQYPGASIRQAIMDILALCNQPTEELRELKNLRNIQGEKGTWDLDNYMTGLYNGLELAVATIENRSPIYKDTNPAKELRAWEDLTEDEKSNVKEFLPQDSDFKLCYEFILSLATKPKEQAVWVVWYKDWETIHTYLDLPVFNMNEWTIIKTTNPKIKEIGIMVVDWEKAIERGEA